MMTLLRDFIGQPLQWKRPRFFSTDYELHAGNEIIASIQRSGMWKKRVIAEADGTQWTFRREGLSRKQFFIYQGLLQAADEPAQPFASFKRNWHSNGELTISDGRTYTWTHSTMSHTWFWKDIYDTTLLSLKKRHLMEIAPEANDSSDLALLTLFGFYLALVREQEAAAAAAAAG